ncbi:MAG: hypothetical protein DCF15_14775 [Phormidesmis priestleyi]|uniref:SHOCT domain-containing protein n=1 Tax=Phormidesmis priestleyi TaxID=268141 RepID=A0A2W4X295_9CYAN|nr:MAG: hypothetical protein DCF15_14775 [Phormidesmis priestleyi]
MPTPANYRKVAISLAFAGALPTPLPLAWLHKFYLGQYLWGVAYLLLAPTGIAQVACCLEGIWYLSQSDEAFSDRFPKSPLAANFGSSPEVLSNSASSTSPDQVAAQVAKALRDLDQLRQEGLMTEYEFEQKRRTLLEKIS